MLVEKFDDILNERDVYSAFLRAFTRFPLKWVGEGREEGGLRKCGYLEEGTLIMFCVSINIRKTILILITAGVTKVLKICTAAGRDRHLNCDNLSTKLNESERTRRRLIKKGPNLLVFLMGLNYT